MLGLRAFDKAEEELREVADDDEGWSQGRTTVVFHDQVVPLKLPEDVGVALYYLECVALHWKGGQIQIISFKTLTFLDLYCTKQPITECCLLFTSVVTLS